MGVEKFFCPVRGVVASIWHVVFDLDNTLYPLDGTSLMAEVRRRMEAWMVEALGLDPGGARELRRRYRLEYGSTLRGLALHHGVTPQAFLAAVHDPVEPADFLARSPELDRVLEELDRPLSILSNAPEGWIRRVLAALGVERRFGKVHDIAFGGYLGKPHPEVYALSLRDLNVPAQACLFVEDEPANLPPAKALGMTTVLVGGEGEPSPGADYRCASVADLPRLLAKLETRKGPMPCPKT